jgi:hypothetical protein
MIDPGKYGIATSGDWAAFLIGASAGGAVDAILNVAGFAEPLVFAGICGAGALGLKRWFDAARGRSRQSGTARKPASRKAGKN